MTESRTSRLVSAVLGNVDEIYIRETHPADLVAAGFEHLEESYPETDFTREGDFFVAYVNEEAVFQFKATPPKGAWDDWGEGVAAALAEVEQARSNEAEVDLTDLSDAFVEGVMGGLDEFSRYASPAAARENRTRRDGNSGTLSIGVERGDDGKFHVDYIYSVDLLESGTLRRGDTLLSVDGTVVEPLSEPEVMQLFRGEIGSDAELSVLRDGAAQPLNLTVRREKWGAHSVAGRLEGDILRIVMIQFDDLGQKALRKLLLKEARAPETAAVILDLRGNPGGLLSAVVESADDFLASGPVATIHGRHKDSHQSFKAKPSPVAMRPMIVLVDESSAAGAEILAATLQENHAALVVGSITYGSGTIQTVMPLPNLGELILTWGEVHTAGGYRLDKRGVMPTVCTGGSATTDAVLAELGSGRGTIDRATRTRDIDPEDAEAIEAFRALCPPRSGDTDISLEVAQAILADPALYKALVTGDRQETAALR
ncbi:S41 family peptidase [Pelagibius marinus]|uniref:S41 family peptidase n=1 Tax=Pelagibius marinus TaxID=2762760 RepID=UPI001872BC29|nr:S41 family peptidase [Pelagibius marinus]